MVGKHTIHFTCLCTYVQYVCMHSMYTYVQMEIRTYVHTYVQFIPDNLGPELTALIIEVSSFQGLKMYCGLL